MDESGIDASLQRNYARAERGKQIISDVCGKKTARTSLIAAWIQHTKSLIAPYVFRFAALRVTATPMLNDSMDG
jgi:hypothetical protein